jgi:hypothetical protein
MSGRRSADIRVLKLSGSPRERGRQHGEAARELIRMMDVRWRDDVSRDTSLHPDDYARRLMDETGFVAAARRHAPALLEEVEGTAEGAGLDFRAAFARQLADEDWWFRFELKYGAGSGEHCSSLGAFGQSDGSTLVAQNMDTPSYWDGGQVLLHQVYPDGLEAFVFTAAGSLALCGLNNAGVGICCNTILQCNHSRRGLPEQFVVRSVLEQRALNGAERFVRAVPHASPQNYIIGGRERVVDLEVSAGQVAEFRPLPNRVYHSNHPLVNDDQSQFRSLLNRLPEDLRAGMVSGSTTLTRLQTLETLLSDKSAPLTVEKVKAVLRTPPVCVAKDEKRITLGCAIMELAPAPRLHLSPGPPDITEFRTYEFDRLADD